MPGGDGTGPMGTGPMTGRGAGRCAGFAMPGYANPGAGAGFGRGQGLGRRRGGGGRGWRHWFRATGLSGWARFGGYGWMPGVPAADPEMEKRALRNQAEVLQSELELVKRRLDEIDKPVASQNE